jgi:hypothetical protein
MRRNAKYRVFELNAPPTGMEEIEGTGAEEEKQEQNQREQEEGTNLGVPLHAESEAAVGCTALG